MEYVSLFEPHSGSMAGSGCMYEHVWNNRGGLMRMIAQEDLEGIIRWAFGGGFRVVSVR